MEETAIIYPVQEGRTPWRRLWARGIDTSICSAIIGAVLAPIILEKGGLITYFDSFIELYLAYLVVILLEPIMVAKFGTTVGKKIFGIRILKDNGEKLTVEEAKKRTYSVFKQGMGYCIPLYDLVCQYKSYGKCKDNELSWDAGISYEVQGKWIVLRMIIGYGLVAAAGYVADMIVAMCL